MALLIKNNNMDIPPTQDFSLNELFAYLIGGGTVLGAYWKHIDNKFREKKLEAEQLKLEREEFITKVAKEAVRAAMDGILGDVKDNINTLFKYREADRKHIDDKFDSIMKELKK